MLPPPSIPRPSPMRWPQGAKSKILSVTATGKQVVRIEMTDANK